MECDLYLDQRRNTGGYVRVLKRHLDETRQGRRGRRRLNSAAKSHDEALFLERLRCVNFPRIWSRAADRQSLVSARLAPGEVQEDHPPLWWGSLHGMKILDEN